MPKKMATSAILSKTESRNAPLVDVFCETIATCPSTISKNPEISNSIPPMINANSIPNP